MHGEHTIGISKFFLIHRLIAYMKECGYDSRYPHPEMEVGKTDERGFAAEWVQEQHCISYSKCPKCKATKFSTNQHQRFLRGLTSVEVQRLGESNSYGDTIFPNIGRMHARMLILYSSIPHESQFSHQYLCICDDDED